jgi:hypothetical protein
MEYDFAAVTLQNPSGELNATIGHHQYQDQVADFVGVIPYGKSMGAR